MLLLEYYIDINVLSILFENNLQFTYYIFMLLIFNNLI